VADRAPARAEGLPPPPPVLVAVVAAPGWPYINLAWAVTVAHDLGPDYAARLAATLAYLTSRHLGLAQTGQLGAVDDAAALAEAGRRPPPASLMGQLRAEAAAILTGRAGDG
jgi:hypothetical protein